MKLVSTTAALLLAWCTLFAMQHWYVAGQERSQTDVRRVAPKALSLREVTHGRMLTRAVLDDTQKMVDCDVVENKLGARRSITDAFGQLDVDPGAADDGSLHARCLQLHQDATAFQPGARAKRSVLVYPGTKWCGKGASARSYDDLGDSRDTDVCCRAHDFCPYTISGLTSKYNLFNYRFHTLSHCDCDDRLRACLDSVKSDVIAQIVGSLYFGISGNDCFILKPEKVCVKRSWWGKCLKYMKTYTAVYRQ